MTATMTSAVKPLLLLTLLVLRGNGSASDFDSSQTDYAGVVADEVRTRDVPIV